MFAPIGNIVSIPPSSTLVATALPNSIALRVPYDNVAPSVSSAQLDNNASGNSTTLLKTNTPQTSTLSDATAEKFFLSTGVNSTSFTANAQTAFLTQLASGDISSETHSIFLQYEKLLSYANVKYKPSNAGKPVEPASLFEATLQQEEKTSIKNLLSSKTATISTARTELPTNPKGSEIMQTSTFAEHTPVPETQLQPTEKITLPQLNAYNATIIRNQDIIPASLESA